jgi:hypothetical protein
VVAVDLDHPIPRPRAFECDDLRRGGCGMGQGRRRLNGLGRLRLGVCSRAKLNQSAPSAHVQLQWPPGVLAGIVQRGEVVRRGDVAKVEDARGVDTRAAAASDQRVVIGAARGHSAYHRRHEGGDHVEKVDTAAGIVTLDFGPGDDKSPKMIERPGSVAQIPSRTLSQRHRPQRRGTSNPGDSHT